MSSNGALELEHTTLLAEFQSVRDDILFNVGAYRQVVNLTLTGAGILAAGTPSIIEANLPVLFLVAPLIFFSLSWIQIRYLFIYYNLHDYLEDSVTPRIRKVLATLSSTDENNYASIMRWETYFREAERRSVLWLLPSIGGAYGISLFVPILSVSAFFANQNSNTIIGILDWTLFIANLLLFVYTVFLGLWAGITRLMRKRYKMLSN